MAIDLVTQNTALALVLAERVRQDAKFGNQDGNAPSRWLQILIEELGEWADADLQKVELAKFDTPEAASDHAFKELVQVAAVALSWVESTLRTESRL